MSKKLYNLITKGLSSELYLLAYLEPNNIRKLAQKLQNTSGTPTNYSKASPEIHNLTIAKYLKHNQNDEKYYVNIDSLSLELENILIEKNILLKEIEKKYLLKVLEENDFFKLISKDIIKKIQAQKKGKHEINALEVFSERIGMMSSTILLYKKMDKRGNFEGLEESNLSFDEKMAKLEEFKHEWEEISEKLDEKFAELLKTMPKMPVIEEMIIPMFKKLPTMTIFFLIPEEILMKFGSLWKGFEGVQLSLQIYNFNNKK